MAAGDSGKLTVICQVVWRWPFSTLYLRMVSLNLICCHTDSQRSYLKMCMINLCEPLHQTVGCLWLLCSSCIQFFSVLWFATELTAAECTLCVLFYAPCSRDGPNVRLGSARHHVTIPPNFGRTSAKIRCRFCSFAFAVCGVLSC